MTHPILLAFIALIPVFVMFYAGYIYPLAWIQVVPLGLTFTAVIAYFVWRMSLIDIFASITQGFVFSSQHLVLLIFIGLFMEVLRATGSLDSMRAGFKRISPDRRIQAIIIAWFFASFLEGLMGFTFTGCATALLLLGIGFPPACAIMLAMMGPVTASAFSCVGTPILFHAAYGLQQPDIIAQLTASQMTLSDYLNHISAYVGVIHGIVGTFMPLMMIIMMTRFFGEKKNWREALDLAPFALFCGLAFTIPYTLTAIFLGPQFPALIGALVGLAAATTVLGMRFLLPSKHWDFPPLEKWEPSWSEGSYEPPQTAPKMPWWLTWSPILILFLLLVISQIPHSLLGDFLKTKIFEKNHFLQTPIALFAQPFFMPASVLIIIASIIALLIDRFKNAHKIFNQRYSHFIVRAAQNLIFIAPLVSLYVHSSFNTSGYPSMVQVIAQGVSQIPMPHFIAAFLTPFLGVAGTNFSSSGMYSIFCLSSYQHCLGQILVANGALFIALHIVGATAGNLFAGHYLDGIALHVGKEGLSGTIGRKVLWPMFVYLIFTGIIGVIVTTFF